MIQCQKVFQTNKALGPTPKTWVRLWIPLNSCRSSLTPVVIGLTLTGSLMNSVQVQSEASSSSGLTLPWDKY